MCGLDLIGYRDDFDSILLDWYGGGVCGHAPKTTGEVRIVNLKSQANFISTHEPNRIEYVNDRESLALVRPLESIEPLIFDQSIGWSPSLARPGFGVGPKT